jgi:predicted HD phosphohydrolase
VDGDSHERAQDRAKYHAMMDGTQADWDLIVKHAAPFQKELPNRIITHLKLLKGDCGGFAVDRLEHCLQTATRAHQAGEDEEYVVSALLHDIGDTLGPANHADVAAVIVKPYVSERNHWIVEKHGMFQGYYFFHFLGLDRNMRDQYRGHPHFEACAQFCHLYDQNSFDPNFKSMPLEAFEPMVQRVFARPKNSMYLRTDNRAAAE